MADSSIAPTAAPTALPLPPKIATPPTNAEHDGQLVAGARARVDRLYCAAHSTPASPAIAPADRERGEHPPADRDAASRAASGLEPIAYSSRPDR